MSYSKNVHTDRAVQYPTRYAKSGETTSGVTLSADPGTITQPGTPVNASVLNHLEQGVYDAHVTADGALQRSGGTMTGVLTSMTNTTGVLTDSVAKPIMIQSDATHPALATFIRQGNFAGHFGIDTDNKWKVGGWSMGAVAYELWHDGRMRVHSSGTYIEWWNGSTWQGVGGVKSIQRGVVGANANGTTDVTITAVNMAKAQISLDAFGPMQLGDSIHPNTLYATLTSSTNLRFVGQGGVNTAAVGWQVIEYY